MPGAEFAAGDDRTRELSRLGVEARQRKAEGLATLAEMPELRDVESAKSICARLVALGKAGALTSAMVNACSRAVEAWLKCEAHALDLDRMKALERRIGELEAELAATRGGSWG